MPPKQEGNPLEQQLEQARAGIEAAARIEPYNNEVLRSAYLGAAALIDESGLKPFEQITHRKEIAQLAGKLATSHQDETTAAEMDARVEDCDAILALLKPGDASSEAKDASSEAPSTPKPRRGRPRKASTAASKTSGAKGP